jgi:putative membrane protein
MQDKGRESRDHSNIWKGLAAGLVGGLVASWTMNRFQDVWASFAAGHEKPPDAEISQHGLRPEKADLQQNNEAQDDTTVKAASAIAEGLFHHKLSKSEKKFAGPAVHYSLGTAAGGLYGVAAEAMPDVTAGAGLTFGTAFWLVVDEGAVPLLGLSKGPAEYPVSTHLYALASHLIFGLTTEMVRRGVRRSW